MKPDTKKQLRKYYFEPGYSAGFEHWLYHNKSIEQELGESSYFALIDADYKTTNGRENVLKKIKDIYPQGLTGLRLDYAQEIAEQALAGTKNLEETCQKLAEFECKGTTIISPLFDSYLDDIDRGTDIKFLEHKIRNELHKLIDLL